jgi:Ca-activated chloride channel family protein
VTNFELFHFIRPLWLLAVPAVLLVWWLVRRQSVASELVTGVVAPHLQDALTTGRSSKSRFKPIDGVVLGLLAATFAAAGPTWSKQHSPWFSETAPLVVALEVSDSMRSNDLQPSRLERARFKVLDLLEQRTGSRTALIAYAGSAHIVMPPSTDSEVLKLFLESLDPAIMPSAGTNAASVLPLADQVLGEETAIGTVLFVTDGFEPLDIPVFAEYASRADGALLVALVVGKDSGGVALMPDGSAVMDPAGGRLDTSIDTALLRRAESEGKVSVVRAETNDSDVRELVRRINSNMQQADDPNAQWLDQAWWLMLLSAACMLSAFRRGWTMQW